MKNLNSFRSEEYINPCIHRTSSLSCIHRTNVINARYVRSVQLAIEHEMIRQAKCYDTGEPIRYYAFAASICAIKYTCIDKKLVCGTRRRLCLE
jgi:hypothetical protein